MKFTARHIIITTLVVATIGAVSLRLKTMEPAGADPADQGPQRTSLYASSAAVLSGNIANVTFQDLWAIANNKTQIDLLIKKLSLPETLEEFKAKGTVNNLEVTDTYFVPEIVMAIKKFFPVYRESFIEEDRNIEECLLSPKGSRLLTLDINSLKVWAPHNGTWLPQIVIDQFSMQAAWSPDGSRILTFNATDDPISVWTFRNNRWEPQEIPDTAVIFAKWSPDGSRFASFNIQGHNDGGEFLPITIWTLHNGIWQPQILPNSNMDFEGRSTEAVVWNADGSSLLASDGEGPIAIWTLHSNTWQHKILPETEGDFAGWSPNGSYLITGRYNTPATIWTLDTWQSQQLPDTQGAHTKPNPKKSQLATFGKTFPITIWDLYNDTWQPYQLPNTQGAIPEWSADGSYLLSKSDNKPITLWLQHKGGWQPKPIPNSKDEIIRGSIDGGCFISKSRGGIKIWMPVNGSWKVKPIATDLHIDDYSSNGSCIVASDSDVITIWEKVDLVGNDNILAKILFLQLAERNEPLVSFTNLENNAHLNAVFETFSPEAQKEILRMYPKILVPMVESMDVSPAGAQAGPSNLNQPQPMQTERARVVRPREEEAAPDVTDKGKQPHRE